MHIYIYIHIHATYTCVCMHIYICVYIYINVCIYTCVYIIAADPWGLSWNSDLCPCSFLEDPMRPGAHDWNSGMGAGRGPKDHGDQGSGPLEEGLRLL